MTEEKLARQEAQLIKDNVIQRRDRVMKGMETDLTSAIRGMARREEGTGMGRTEEGRREGKDIQTVTEARREETVKEAIEGRREEGQDIGKAEGGRQRVDETTETKIRDEGMTIRGNLWREKGLVEGIGEDAQGRKAKDLRIGASFFFLCVGVCVWCLVWRPLWVADMCARVYVCACLHVGSCVCTGPLLDGVMCVSESERERVCV